MNINVSGIKSYLKKLRLRHYIGLFGVSLIFLGWILANAPRWPVVYRFITPHYAHAMWALDKMGEKGFVLEPGDRGFEEIAGVIKGYFEETVNREVEHVRTLNRGADVLEDVDGARWQPFLELEVAFPGEPSFQGRFYDLESRFREAYLKSRLLAWRDAVFGVGVILVVAGLFL